MNPSLLFAIISLAVTRAENAPAMLIIIYWILILLWAIGAFWANPQTYPNVVKGSNVVMLILFSIIGYYLFGF